MRLRAAMNRKVRLDSLGTIRTGAHARRELAERGATMPRGDKSAYTGKPQRQAERVEKNEMARGRPREAAERIAWATANRQDGGGKRTGSGRKRAA
jgi:hypothetical protein